MNFASYTDYKALLLRQLDVAGDDFGDDGDDAIDDAIELSEERIWTDPDLKFAEQEQALGVAISNNIAVLPADFEQFHTVSLNMGRPLDILPVETIRTLIASLSSSTSSFVAVEGLNAIFFPAQTSGMMTGTYFRKLVPFRTAPTIINGLYQRYPRLMVWAALKELADLIGSPRSQEFELKYTNPVTGDGEKERAIKRETARKFTGRRLVRGNSVNIIERNRGLLIGTNTPVTGGGGGQIVLPGDQVITIVGSTLGIVFGASPYGVNSDIATAAVHAGLVANGATATILVHYVGLVASFTGNTQHGVTSQTEPASDGMVLSLANTTGIPVVQDGIGHWSPMTFTAVTA